MVVSRRQRGDPERGRLDERRADHRHRGRVDRALHVQRRLREEFGHVRPHLVVVLRAHVVPGGPADLPEQRAADRHRALHGRRPAPLRGRDGEKHGRRREGLVVLLRRLGLDAGEQAVGEQRAADQPRVLHGERRDPFLRRDDPEHRRRCEGVVVVLQRQRILRLEQAEREQGPADRHRAAVERQLQRRHAAARKRVLVVVLRRHRGERGQAREPERRADRGYRAVHQERHEAVRDRAAERPELREQPPARDHAHGAERRQLRRVREEGRRQHPRRAPVEHDLRAGELDEGRAPPLHDAADHERHRRGHARRVVQLLGSSPRIRPNKDVCPDPAWESVPGQPWRVTTTIQDGLDADDAELGQPHHARVPASATGIRR